MPSHIPGQIIALALGLGEDQHLQGLASHQSGKGKLMSKKASCQGTLERKGLGLVIRFSQNEIEWGIGEVRSISFSVLRIRS